MPLHGHLVLVGLPGSGKSTVGRAVARLVDRPFLDFDQEIVRRTGMSVSAIFETRGEAAFREEEVALTRELAGASPMILAPGGGWITNVGVVDMLRPPALLVYLRVSVAESLRRLRRSRNVRPLLASEDPGARLQQLMDQRAPLYKDADVVIDAETFDSQRLVEFVAALARDGQSALG
jgi:shikimate kinase